MESYNFGNKNDTVENKTKLHDCLKQLEFITCFEAHLERKKNYPIEYLQILDSIKQQTQVNTIKAISYYKKQ